MSKTSLCIQLSYGGRTQIMGEAACGPLHAVWVLCRERPIASKLVSADRTVNSVRSLVNTSARKVLASSLS